MAMHATHKILAAAAGVDKVQPGEIVKAKVDLAGINDIYLMVANVFEEMGGKQVWDPEKVFIFMDHNAPSPTIKGADNQKKFREFAKKYNIPNVYEINRGICHLALRENGLIKPSDIVIITDSHTTTHGAFGAFSTGVGSTDMAMILLEGELWIRVPDVVNVVLNGKLKPGVMAKDAALMVLGQLGTDFANYKVIEFSGTAVDEMSLDERFVLTNMAVEMGAKTTYIKPDKKTVDYVKERTDKPFKTYETDRDYEYVNTFTFDVSDLQPQVALPHAVDNVKPISEVTDKKKVDQVFLGSCTGGKFEDIETAAKIMRGKKLAAGTRMIVTMGSEEILRKAIENGYYQILLDAGAAITTPGCGACFGGHSGLLADGEVCVSTSNRNFIGRMGSDQAELYLVSPIVAALTAINGVLTAPETASK